jgi:hypothetical protein
MRGVRVCGACVLCCGASGRAGCVGVRVCAVQRVCCKKLAYDGYAASPKVLANVANGA